MAAAAPKFEWVVAPRDYDREAEALAAALTDADADHPLIPPKPKESVTISVQALATVTTLTQDGTITSDPLSDPLSAASSDPLSGADDPLNAASMLADPLNAMGAFQDGARGRSGNAMSPGSAEPLSAGSATSGKAGAPGAVLDENFVPWSAKKNGILSKYTTSAKLAISTSFMSNKDVPKAVVDKTKQRLESLEDDDEGSMQTMLDLSQQDYIKHIDELQQQLIAAWDTEQRVKSLKIAIQNAKMLADTRVPQFYPSKFVLITEILDTFGRLVYERIFEKATYIKPGSATPVPLPIDFTPDMVSEGAKETCRNWFFKIASIRELVPRLYALRRGSGGMLHICMYVELAILKCYKFLAKDDYSNALQRLCMMVRGIGNPLVATYCRAYLCRKGMDVAPGATKHLLTAFYDFAYAYKQMKQERVQDLLTEFNLTYPAYVDLYTPAVDWILQCVAHGATKETLKSILDKYTAHCRDALVLDSIMTSFPPDYVSDHAIHFTELIRSADAESYPQHLLYHTLGVNLVLHSPPKETQLAILREVWKVLSLLKDAKDYIKCAEVYIELPAKNFTYLEVDALLGDVVKHLTPERAFEKLQPQLQSMVEKMLIHMTNFSEVFMMENFMPLLDFFQPGPIQVEVAKAIMASFSRSHTETLSDFLIVNSVLYIAKILHDSINASTFEDEKRQISALILHFVRRVDYDRDFEQQLNFYVQARAAFPNLDGILQAVVHSSCNLIMRIHKIVKGNHTRKTGAFVRAAVAFTYITIPSIMSAWGRLPLFLLSSQVALINGCLPQAEAMLKAAITLIADLPNMTEMELGTIELAAREQYLVNYVSAFTAMLLMVPGHPENGPFFLLKGLINAVQAYRWDAMGENKLAIYLNILNLLSGLRQSKCLYAAENVESNKDLYDGDDRYFGELDLIAGTLLAEVIKFLQGTEGDALSAQRRAHIAMELLDRVGTIGSLASSSSRKLAGSLVTLAKKGPLSSADQAYLRSAMAAYASGRLSPIVSDEQQQVLQMLAAA